MSGKTLAELFVLLVEPSSSQAKFIGKSLNEAGLAHIDVVKDGQSALQFIMTHRPNLVISAMYLPDMTATELVTSLREDSELGETAFMLISSETGFEQIDPIKQAGVSAILPKPFEAHQLKRALYNTLDMLSTRELQLEDIQVEDLKVLIVDDSNMARKHIRRVLNGMGIDQIVEADDGAAAVPLLDDHFFDFVVTDYNMPQMDGKALLEHIRNNSNQRSIPVLMVTSEGNMGNLAAVEQAGVSGICDKPFETDTVRALILSMMTEV